MELYNFEKTYFWCAAVLLLIAITLLVLSIYQVVLLIKTLRVNAAKISVQEIIPRSILLVVLIGFTIVFSIHLTMLIPMCGRILTKNYTTTTGAITNIHVVRNDYRDNEEYDLSFTIGETTFENAMNTFTKEQVENISSKEHQIVTINYAYVNNTLVIYAIKSNS